MKKALLLCGSWLCFAMGIHAQQYFQWAKNITPTTADNYSIIATVASPDGHVYIAATGGSPAENFLLKYTPAGSLVWKRTVTADILTFSNIAVDLNNQVVALGWQYNQGIRLAKLDADGNQLWLKAVPGYYSESTGMAVDNANNIYIIARKNTGGSADSAMVKKFSPEGNFLQNSPPFFYCHKMAMALNSANELFVTGEVDPGFYPSTVFGKIDNTPIFLAEPSWFYGNFIAKFSPALATQWIKTSSGSSSYSNCIAVDNNYVYSLWAEKVWGSFSFYPRINRFDLNGNFIDSIRYAGVTSMLVPAFKLAKADTSLFVLQYAAQPYNTPDTAFIHQYHENLQLRNTFSAKASTMSATQLCTVDRAAYVTGSFYDPTGMAKFDTLTVWSNAVGATSHTDMFLSKIGGATAALPVKLNYFTGALKDRQATIQWSALNETNLQAYHVLKSTNGTVFSNMGTVQPTSTMQYSFVDDLRNETAPTIYYQLEILDRDGTKTYSNIVALNLGKQGVQLSIYPNPAHQNLSIKVPGGIPPFMLSIVDAQGKTVLQQHILTASASLSIAGLARGSYMVVATTRDGQQNIKLLVE